MHECIVVARAIHFAAVLWLFGEFVLFAVVAVPAARSERERVSGIRDDTKRRLVRVGLGCVAIGIVSSIAWLLLEASVMSGAPLAVALNRDTLQTVIGETHFGRVWLARLGLSLLLCAALWLLGRDRPRRGNAFVKVGGTVLAGAYAATLALTGHAIADSGFDHYIHLVADAVHLLAAGSWIGALPGFIFLLNRGPEQAGPQTFAMVLSATQRFSIVGMVDVGALVVTGLVNSAYLVGSVAALPGTEYGRLLLCKLVLFAVMVALAAVNRLWLTPQLRAAISGLPVRETLARLRRNTLLELALGATVIGIVAALGVTTPAVHMGDRDGTHAMPMHGQSR